jgi:S-adenosylmethionine-dependent methyltransferase
LNLQQLEAAAYEAVLMMGPLYHLLSQEERLSAVYETLRILKPGGLLFAAFITRFAPFGDLAASRPEWVLENLDYAQHVLETGIHDRVTEFTQAYFGHPDEIIPKMESTGLQTIEMVGCEGIVAGHEEKINQLEGEVWQAWVNLNHRLGKEKTLWGAADHLLYVGRKP